jgi:hypothetical protein
MMVWILTVRHTSQTERICPLISTPGIGPVASLHIDLPVTGVLLVPVFISLYVLPDTSLKRKKRERKRE